MLRYKSGAYTASWRGVQWFVALVAVHFRCSIAPAQKAKAGRIDVDQPIVRYSHCWVRLVGFVFGLLISKRKKPSNLRLKWV